MTGRTRSGLLKFRAVPPGSTIAVVAPASRFVREHFDDGVAELRRLGFSPVFEDSVFAREEIVAGSAELRARAIVDAMQRDDVDALIAVRGGYGSVEVLPHLDALTFRGAPKAFIGYSSNARTPGPRVPASRSRINRSRIGIRKLSVLPEPVPVVTTTLRPAPTFRIACS